MKHTAETAFAAGHILQIIEIACLVIQHFVVSQHIAIERNGTVDVRATGHCTHDAAAQALLLNEDIFVLHHLEVVAPGVLDHKTLPAVGHLRHGTHFVVLGGQLLAESIDVAALDLGCKNTQVAHLHTEVARLRFALAVLPDLESTATLKVDGNAGVPLLGLAAGVGQHPLGHRVVLKDAHIHLEHIYIPAPRCLKIKASDTDLLYSGNKKIVHCQLYIFYFLLLLNARLCKKLFLSVLKEKKNFLRGNSFHSPLHSQPFLCVVLSLVLCGFRVQCMQSDIPFGLDEKDAVAYLPLLSKKHLETHSNPAANLPSILTFQTLI